MALLGKCFCVLATIFVIASETNGRARYKKMLKYPLYKRDHWGATPSTYERPLKTPVEYVVIHHTATPGACYTFQNCSKAMRSMQGYHNSLNWGDIGYNFCVGSEGGAYEGRGWHQVGMHALQANSFSIGICLIGDWTAELPPPKQLRTTKALISLGVQKGVISPSYKLVGHRQVTATECPGDALFNHISKWQHFRPGQVEF